MSDYTVVEREGAEDFMAQYPGFGEMRTYAPSLGTEQVALTWRKMPPGTGGKGSYGHRHKTQEELYLVVSGNVQVKVDDEVLELGPKSAIRIAPRVVRSIHNDGPEPAEVVMVSVKLDDPMGDAEQVPDFWPEG
jgi:mannose-6-phosphate isomerase-like protein (cupin superfamily)